MATSTSSGGHIIDERRKRGWLAGLVNMIIPGSCHIYLADGNWLMGLLTFFLFGPLWFLLLRFVLQVFIWPMADTPARGWIALAATAFFVLMYFAILFTDGRFWTKKYKAGLRGNRLF